MKGLVFIYNAQTVTLFEIQVHEFRAFKLSYNTWVNNNVQLHKDNFFTKSSN